MVNILSDHFWVHRYYEYFKNHGFDIKRDFKKYRINENDYLLILSELSNPIYYLNKKGQLQSSNDKCLIIKKFYLPYQNNSKNSGIRLIALITVFNSKNQVYIMPFHIYLK